MQNFGSYPMASGGMPSMMGMGAASSGAAGAGPKMMAAGPAVYGQPTDWNSMLRMVSGQGSYGPSQAALARGAEYGPPNANTKTYQPLGTAYTPGIMGGPAQNQPGGGPRTLPGPGTTKMPGQGGTAYTPGIMGGPSQSAASGYPGFGNMTNPNSLSAMMAAQRRGEASANEQAYQNRPGSSAADSQYDQQMQMINQQMGGGFRPEAGQSRLLNQSGPGAAYQGMASMGLPPSAIASQNAMMASLRNGTYQQPQAYMHPNMNQNYLGASASMMPFQMASGTHRGSIPVMGQPGRWTNG